MLRQNLLTIRSILCAAILILYSSLAYGESLPNAAEILENGKILHKEIVYDKRYGNNAAANLFYSAHYDIAYNGKIYRCDWEVSGVLCYQIRQRETY